MDHELDQASSQVDTGVDVERCHGFCEPGPDYYCPSCADRDYRRSVFEHRLTGFAIGFAMMWAMMGGIGDLLRYVHDLIIRGY